MSSNPAGASMDLPIIDVDVFMSQSPDSEAYISECKKAAQALVTYGALILHDTRVVEENNVSFLDLLEDYFAQPTEVLQKDERPELGYQVGATLEHTEKPKCAVHEPCLDIISKLDPSQRPLDISGHSPDPKCRFFWRMQTQPPYETAFPGLNTANVVPQDPDIKARWPETMGVWGGSMLQSVETLTEMLAVGLGLPTSTFKDAGKYGPHILAPTATNLSKFGAKDTILAGFHTDLNFLTIHGRSRYPGLNIWARNTGRRIPVKMPVGNYLLVQAGKQLEHLTGGHIKAGYHEVVVNDATLEVMDKRRQTHPERPLIRISSTFFWHLSSDYDLEPIPSLASLSIQNEKKDVYEKMKVGEQVQHELRHIALMA